MNALSLLRKWRVILLLVCLLLAIVAIHPRWWSEGAVTIRSVEPNSSAARAGLQSPSSKLTPLAKERIISINGKPTFSLDQYLDIVQDLSPNTTITLQSNKGTYTLITSSETPSELGLHVYDTPSSNLRKGLDLEGGTRVVLQPAEETNAETLDIIIETLQQRLNVYGLSDVVIRAASDLAGKEFIIIEIAGVTKEEVKELLARQGKFEAKIGNSTVFIGGNKDVTHVCRTADCSGIDPSVGCQQTAEGYACGFFFGITLSPEAAARQADVTKTLSVINERNGGYLDQELVLFLDDVEVDRLRIGAELKGRPSTNIQISGGGTGRTEQEAATIALQNMKKLQTVLITGSLPVKLDVVKFDTISPSIGQEFLSNLLLVGGVVLLSVITVVIYRYRNLKIVLPMVLILICEVIILLGFAAISRWNLDVAAITGILIVIGTGVDHLIVITDETVKGQVVSDWKKKIKNAMFILMGVFFTNIAALLPLLWIGAGLIKGFALTSIAGLALGIFIARPAYAVIIEELLKE